MKITWTKKSLLDRQEKAVNTHTQRRCQHYNFEYESKTRKNRKFMQQVIDISSSPTSTLFFKHKNTNDLSNSIYGLQVMYDNIKKI